ncbi:transposase InsO family protein [Salinibacter ruber]|nr:transposase InsO family protein [Salinibacter ruber]
MASHPRAELVLEALDMAAQQHIPEETIHHPDQSSQYAAIAFGKRRGDGGVRRWGQSETAETGQWPNLFSRRSNAS